MSASSLDQPAPRQDDNVKRRRRRISASITANACTACRQKRAKCDGQSPCSRCHSFSNSPPCTYITHSKVIKTEMQREIDQLRKENGVLRESNLASIEVLDALRSHRDVPRILKLLQDHKDLVDIADIASVSQFTQSSVGSPASVKAIKEETCGSSPRFGSTSSFPESWTSAPENQLLMKHLLSLYWTWIHPARPLFDMKLLIQRLMAGTEEHASLFLVAAVCAAACDLLSPAWTESLVVGCDIPNLKRNFITEANRQEALAEEHAPTTVEALQVMRIADLRFMQAGATSGVCGMEIDPQCMPPEIESQAIHRWLESVDSPVS